MDEVRAKWEELRLLLCEAQAVSEELATAFRASQPRPLNTDWGSPDRVNWRRYWDRYSELDYDLWQAYCHANQIPVWTEFEQS